MKPYVILMVCHANQIRSPMAQQIMLAHLQRDFGDRTYDLWDVESAGTDVARPTLPHPFVHEVLSEMGIRGPRGMARQVTNRIIEGSDLILCADRSQRASVARVNPGSIQRTFTLRQFGRLCEAGRGADSGVRITCGADLERLVQLGREKVRWVPPEEDDIPDPIGGDLSVFRSAAQLILTCVRQILGD